MSTQQVTVRKGFCHVYEGQTYTYGFVCSTDSPIYHANKAAFMLAPACLVAPAPEPELEELPPLPIEIAADDDELEV